MKRKPIYILALVLLLSLTLAACGEHEHEFDVKWSVDAINHWHAAICGDTEEAADKDAHGFKTSADGKTEQCEVCGYSRNVIVTPDPKPHEHTYATEFSANESGHFRVATCEHADEVTDNAPHAYVDGICTVCKWWSSATDVLLAELSKMDVWDYTVSIDDVTINNVNLLSVGIEHDSIVVNGELKLSVDSDGKISGCGYFALNDEQFAKAVIDDNVVYAIVSGNSDDGSRYIRCQLDELLEFCGVDVSQVTSYVDKINANTRKIRDYVSKIASAVKYLPAEKISQLISQFVAIDDEQSANGLTAYIVNCDVLRTLNETLAAATVADYVDRAYGDGFFANLPAFIEGLFDMHVYEVFDIIEEKFDLTFDEVFELIDSLAADYYPDENVNTIDELLAAIGKPLNAPLKSLIYINKLSRLGFLLDTLQKIGSVNINVADIVAKVTDFCNAYGDKTIYRIVLGNNAEMSVDELKQLVDDAADKLEATPATVFVDGENVIQRIAADGENGSIALTRGQDLTQDYSNVIDDVNASVNAAA